MESKLTLKEYLEEIKGTFQARLADYSLTAINEFLDSSDFYNAPAAAKHHMATPHGLFIHSSLVWRNLLMLNEQLKLNLDEVSMFVVAYFHDLCKVNYYVTESKWRKDDRGKWEYYQAYTVKDDLPLGHGEKSLYIASKFFALTDDEAMAIRWHMGMTDQGAHHYFPSGAPFQQAFGSNKLLGALHSADMLTGVLETITSFRDPYLKVKFDIELTPSLRIKDYNQKAEFLTE